MLTLPPAPPQKSISTLSDVRLNRDYTSKILQLISLHQPNPHPLILKYLRTSKPLLTEPDDIELYVVALAESSVGEAWEYQRGFPETPVGKKGGGGGEGGVMGMRERLVRRIVWWALEREFRSIPIHPFIRD